MRCRKRSCLLSFVVCLLMVGSHRQAKCADQPIIEFVVGHRTSAEGGSWDPAESVLKRPFGIDFDPAGNMYVVELEGGRVFKMNTAGQLTRIAGDGSQSYKGDGGVAGDATFNGMHNCAVSPAGDLFISDSWNHCIRRIDLKTGLVSTVAGNGQKGFSGDGAMAADAAFDFLMCVTLNSDNSILLITDLSNRRIRALDLKSGKISCVCGNGKKGVPVDGAVATDSPLVDPRAAAADSHGNVYVLERGGHALRVVRPDGTVHTVAGTGERGFADGPALSSRFNSPKHICVDHSDHVLIADDQNGAVRRYDPKTQTVSTLLGRGHGDADIKLTNPHGVCFHDGWLYVVDSSNNRVLRIKSGDSGG